MSDPLRDRRLPRELAENQQVIEISEKIHNFETLARVLERDLAALKPDQLPADWRNSILTGRLEFGFVGARSEFPTLTGTLAVTVVAMCQRCLEPFELPLATTFRLVLAEPRSTEDAADGYEIWELAGDAVSPIEIVEEALLLAMPLSTMHERCINVETAVAAKEMTTPFASLRRQMGKRKTD